jgi:hypothetical protein
MFFLLGVLFLAVGAIPLFRAVKTSRPEEDRAAARRSIMAGVWVLAAFAAVLIALQVFLAYYTEFFWFDRIGFENRFWTEITVKVVLFFLGAGAAFAFFTLNILTGAPRGLGPVVRWSLLLAGALLAVLLGLQASGAWEETLLYLNQTESGVMDPVFERSIPFYLFSLPFYSALLTFARGMILLAAALIVAGRVGAAAVRNEDVQQIEGIARQVSPLRNHLLFLGGLFFVTQAIGAWISIFELMYSKTGVVTGAGWLDVNVRVPVYWITIGVHLAVSALLFASIASPGLINRVLGIQAVGSQGEIRAGRRTWAVPAIVLGGLFLLNGVVPSLVQSYVVNPNEITLERPFIRHNIDFTRRAYRLRDPFLQSRRFTAGRDITPEVVRGNEKTLQNIRLWDWRALLDNLQQQQEIRLYYEFTDVDIDRYRIDGEYRQMMLSVRELEKSALAPKSQTWVSRHLKYTHGHGLVLLPVHEFLPQGSPNLLIRNIPPEVTVPGFTVTRPEIYYGENTTDHVYVRTEEQEFDYPSGDKNVYTTYQGAGGVPLQHLFKRFAYAWKFEEVQLLFSTYFTEESRVMFRRAIIPRLRALAPFLRYDRDPYPVVTREGRIKYIVDTYTVSDRYPYSETYEGSLGAFQGVNYMRNAVKAVVDAYDGTVSFYVFDEEDPILNTYDKVFPGLFRPRSEMPAFLERHVRYPDDYLTVQAEMYATYHMADVGVFYQREDVWAFATERYRESFQDVEPYYVMIQLPDRDELEFVLMIPFTPKNKNVINAWVAGRCDPPHYGELLVFTYPKGVEVLGPRQIEARIDQDAEMSQRLSLWGQRGSEVVRGNLLAIPLFSGKALYMLFAEPIFLQAENAQLPQIKRIALADQTQVVWADTFDAALRRLIGAERAEEEGEEAAGLPGKGPGERRIQQAVDLFRSYKSRLRSGDFAGAGEKMQELDRLLGRMAGEEKGVDEKE